MNSQPSHLPEVCKVLIVEDDDGFVMLYEKFLNSSDTRHHVITRTRNAEKGIAKCIEESFDCLIVDYNLPDMTGTDLLAKLSAMLGSRMPPAIILTASESGETVMQALRADAKDFLPKRTISKLSLNTAIDNVLSKAALMTALQDRNEKLELAHSELTWKNEELTRFYHTVSHEVKSPLTAIQEFTMLLKDGIPGPVNEEQTVMLAYTQECCEQIAQHFNDLLHITQIETGKLVLRLKMQSLKYIVTRCVEGAMGLAREKDIELSLHCTEPLSDINIDGNRVSQVITNLLSNAIKYTQATGFVKVTLSYDTKAESQVVSVMDNGAGIESSELENVFERLYQVSSVGQDGVRSPGLGLGLPIALENVRCHGGSLTVSSKFGEGSTFRMMLPVGTVVDDSSGQLRRAS